MVYPTKFANWQIKCRYNIKNNDNIKLPLAHIRKIKNTVEGKTLAIDKTITLTKAIMGRKKSDISVRKK